MYVDETHINYKTAIPNVFKVRAVHKACKYSNSNILTRVSFYGDPFCEAHIICGRRMNCCVRYW